MASVHMWLYVQPLYDMVYFSTYSDMYVQWNLYYVETLRSDGGL